LQKRELVYSIGNLLTLIGIVILVVFTLLPPATSVSGLSRTGINILSSLLLLAGSGIPIILKEAEISQRLRSIGLRCFTTSFITSIIMVLQMLTRGWASTVPVSASIILASIGIAAYILSTRGGKFTPPPLKEILLVLSAVIVFSTPMLQLLLIRVGVSTDVSRILSISLLVVFMITLYLYFKVPFRGVRIQNTREKKS